MSGKTSEKPIGIFDSGVGGVSVLGELIKQLPKEKFIYLADSHNAPYGTKEKDKVRELSLEAARTLVEKGVKALVVACNTATAVAINQLRSELDIPVIGMEPAVKPAVQLGREGKILVMATPVTLSQEKFNLLLHRFDEQFRVIPLPCPGLVELIEQGKVRGSEVKSYLEKLYSELGEEKIAVVVLGCTHYVFIKDHIKELFPDSSIIDGNCGTAKQLRKVLFDKDCLAKSGKAEVEFITSGNPSNVIPLCKNLLEKTLELQ